MVNIPAKIIASPSWQVWRRSADGTGAASAARNPLTFYTLSFVVLDFITQVGLFFFGDTAIRLPMRMLTFVTSLGLIILLQKGRGIPHPASRWFNFILCVLIICALNPSGDTYLSRAAQIALYSAVLAPLLWVGWAGVDRKTFFRIVLIFWAFYTISSLFGVLQVEYPGRFDGAMTANFDSKDLAQYLVVLANGTKILRPKGLTDIPGGAAYSGMSAVVFGIGVLLIERKLLLKAFAVVGMLAGLFCVYLSQVRTDLILVGIAIAIMLVMLQRRKDNKRFAMLLGTAVIIAIAGTSLAFAVGGQATIERFSTLTEDAPGQVYYQNRGHFLQTLLQEEIFEYPIGAGIGRWGMMTGYFGGTSELLWAEMSWQGFLYDGGLPLIGLYLCLIAQLLRTGYKACVVRDDPSIGTWAVVIFAFTSATLVASFDFPMFTSQMGLEMFILNAALGSVLVTQKLPTAKLGHAFDAEAKGKAT